MHPEYLLNNDTQDISRRVSELALSNEPALCAHCQEVSRQTDTSSLSLAEDYAAQMNDANATLAIIGESLQELSRSLLQNAGVFRTQSGKAGFSAVCRAVTRIEEARRQLIAQVGALSGMRFAIAAGVAKANHARHLLSLAARAVLAEARAPYTESTERIKVAYERMLAIDSATGEAQSFYMAFIERHLPSFMAGIRAAADFNHGGESLDTGAIRALCGEMLLLLNRVPKVAF